MVIGDTVVRKSYDKDITFKIIDIKEDNGTIIYILKGISIRIIADSPADDLEPVDISFIGEKEKILNTRVNNAIKNAISTRANRLQKEKINFRGSKSSKHPAINELAFGRPGKILHIDGDKEYI